MRISPRGTHCDNTEILKYQLLTGVYCSKCESVSVSALWVTARLLLGGCLLAARVSLPACAGRMAALIPTNDDVYLHRLAAWRAKLH